MSKTERMAVAAEIMPHRQMSVAVRKEHRDKFFKEDHGKIMRVREVYPAVFREGVRVTLENNLENKIYGVNGEEYFEWEWLEPYLRPGTGERA